MLSLIMAAALTAQGTGPLDGDRLTQLARYAHAAETIDPAWDGQPFVATMDLTPLDEVSVDAAHSPAVWAYSSEEQTLYLIVGGPRLTAGNYDDFTAQNLQRYSNVRPVFVSVDEKSRKPLDPMDLMMRPTNFQEMVDTMRMMPAGRFPIEHLTAFSVALVDLEPAEAAPAPLQGRIVLRRPMSRGDARTLVRDLKLTVEGRLASDHGPFCGGFTHRRAVDEVTSQRTIDLADTQCFLPAVIDRMALIRGDGSVFAEWPAPAAN